MSVSLFTLALVIDLPGGNDFVEDSGERFILSNDPRWDERRHDELPLTNVGLHSYPVREGDRRRNRLTKWLTTD